MESTGNAAFESGKEIVVFCLVTDSVCFECGAELWKGDFLQMEKGKPLCLACADLDHLVFLPGGDAALTRRSRKYSTLSAIVVRFSRAILRCGQLSASSYPRWREAGKNRPIANRAIRIFAVDPLFNRSQ